jgi:hypothetical protein
MFYGVFLMKKYLFCILFLLASCASIKYDNSEYTKFVNIMATLSKPDAFCEKSVVSKNTNQLFDDTHWITLYQGGQPDNNDMILIMRNIENDEIRFKTLVDAGGISPTYCKSKLTDLLHTWQLALIVEGSKPR